MQIAHEEPVKAEATTARWAPLRKLEADLGSNKMKTLARLLLLIPCFVDDKQPKQLKQQPNQTQEPNEHDNQCGRASKQANLVLNSHALSHHELQLGLVVC